MTQSSTQSLSTAALQGSTDSTSGWRARGRFGRTRKLINGSRRLSLWKSTMLTMTTSTIWFAIVSSFLLILLSQNQCYSYHHQRQQGIVNKSSNEKGRRGFGGSVLAFSTLPLTTTRSSSSTTTTTTRPLAFSSTHEVVRRRVPPPPSGSSSSSTHDVILLLLGFTQPTSPFSRFRSVYGCSTNTPARVVGRTVGHPRRRRNVRLAASLQQDGLDEEEEEDDGWGSNASSAPSKSMDEMTQELRSLQTSSQSMTSTNTVRNQNLDQNKGQDGQEQERDLFIPVFAVVSLMGLFGSYGYEMLRLYSRGELYLPWMDN
mmetsp:Transcript_41526/g.99507  ORF Transcript_41526/g.99507 Transcript_41526/m.99507 type:complete len:316 (+) Transcript_41526:18-965(+)